MKDIAFSLLDIQELVCFVFQLIVTYSSQFTWQGHRKLQWAMSKDEPLLANCPPRLETAELSRNYARVPGYKKKYKRKTRKRRKKKRKRNGVEINTRAYVATRLLLRWDYLYAVTLKTKVFGDYNHARLEVSWITSTRQLLLCGYTGFVATNTRCTRSVFSYVTVRGLCLWRRNVFNLSSPTLHVREIPFLVSHATFLPFRNTSIVRVHLRNRASLRTSRSITPSTRVAWTRTQLLLFVLRFLPK